MSRQVQIEDQQLVLHLTGLTSVGALKREVAIPYSSIKSVTVEDFKVSLLKFRVGTSIADIRQGRFLIGDRWCFISYENHRDVVVLELSGHEFGKVVFQIDNPEEVKAQIEARI
ncbi:hypothetical protein FHS18_005609 [Paenibacillus phyllosphaerae]|uniref:PH domain-containing protein n=1 Tax=Paenibacillus phyllosphaerae TaxID=274593 RepID=A0A7W5B305_9BACL|nr:hypothetical protein [Paenibacillus phyllosphaerae]MBB3113497.1 hypothetical protein [Paenibacillus phyllosphaerae]